MKKKAKKNPPYTGGFECVHCHSTADPCACSTARQVPDNVTPAPAPAPLADMKEARTSARKADLTHLRTPFLTYGARACEYGGEKYERANYLRPTASITDDFARLRTYLRAGVAHTLAVLDAMELHQATDPRLADVEGMKRAAFCPDTDEDVTGKVGPSGLPHLCGAVASLNMAITQATRAGLLPADPGQPWKKRVSTKGVAPGTTTISLADGQAITISDWIDDQLYSTVTLNAFDRTGLRPGVPLASTSLPSRVRKLLAAHNIDTVQELMDRPALARTIAGIGPVGRKEIAKVMRTHRRREAARVTPSTRSLPATRISRSQTGA